MSRGVHISLLALLAVSPSVVSAQSSTGAPAPMAIVRVVSCRMIAEPAERLTCFDRAVQAMDLAQRSGDLVTMDRQQVRKTRRSLFGLALPDLGVFGDSDSSDGASAIDTSIRAARRDSRGKWTIELIEGGRWVQLDSRQFMIDPAPGQPVRIRRAALGSYLANINKQIAVRVRRIK